MTLRPYAIDFKRHPDDPDVLTLIRYHHSEEEATRAAIQILAREYRNPVLMSVTEIDETANYSKGE